MLMMVNNPRKNKMNTVDIVVFRRWKGSGDAIALFPELPADVHGQYCDAYEHVGQHGGAFYDGVIRQTKPCLLDAATDLAAELRTIGYRLRPVKRANRKHHEMRQRLASDLRKTV
jgi:hypothetical protein